MRGRRSFRPALAFAALLISGVCAPKQVRAAISKCEYKVAKGDTLSRIARRKGVSEKNLVRANPKLKKNPNRLRVGQTLKICAAKRLQERRPQSCGKGGRIVVHKVAKGQTVAGIAAKYSVSRASVRRYNAKLNKRTNSMIRVGESLRVCTKNRRYTHRAWLKDGVQLATGDGYNIRRPDNAWGTPATVAGITAAVAAYRVEYPDAPLVQIGDISRSNGGPLRSHLSHQDGRDVDIGYVFIEPTEEGERRRIDVARSWSLLAQFVADDSLAAIFVDYRLQRRLYEHAESVGVPTAELDEIFEYPRGGDGKGVVVHWPGHARHFHVRFKRKPKLAEPSS